MYTAKFLEKVDNGKGYFKHQKIGVFKHEELVGSFIRNYDGHGVETFAPFEKDGEWFALYSPDYTCIRILRLPDCTDIGGEEPSDYGFCPMEIYIPQYHFWKFFGKTTEELLKYPEQNRSRLKRDREEKVFDLDCLQNQEEKTELFYANFAFVSGCLWGDDTSAKIEIRDISQAHNGVIKRISDWGYYEMPNNPNLSLKDCVELNAFERNVGEDTDTINVTLTITKTIRLNRDPKINEDFKLEFFN